MTTQTIPATFTPRTCRAMFAALQRASTVLAYTVTLRVPIDGDAEKTLKAVDDALALAIDGAA